MASADPWEADTLERAPPSPTPHFHFAPIPVVGSRHPLWDDEGLGWSEASDDPRSVSLGLEGAR